MEPTNDQRITIDNVKIHVEYYPCTSGTEKETVVLIHGYLSSTFSFRRLIPLLTKNYAVAAVDLPGFGQSEKPKSFVYSLANYGKLILSLLQKYQLDKAVLIGHSMGGQVALQAAKQAPQHIRKLILLASSGYMKPFSRRLVALSYMPSFTYWVRKLFEKRNAREIIHEVVFDPAIIDDHMVDTYIHPMEDKAFYRSLVGLLRHHGGDLPPEQLASIHTPALLLWGKEDRIVPLHIGERLAADLPNQTLKVYEQTGHLVPEERPAEVCRDIETFLTAP